jgi:hypothetical protein
MMFTFESFLEMIGGVALLIMGRRLYWLFVGLIGFVVGALLSQQFFSAQPEWMSVLVALGFGVAGALLAVFLQGIAIAAAGFIAGGFAMIWLLDLVGLGDGQFSWIPFILGGIVGVVFVGFLFDWALIVLSSLVGALLVTRSLDLAVNLNSAASNLIAILLAIAGVVIQAFTLRGRSQKTEG